MFALPPLVDLLLSLDDRSHDWPRSTSLLVMMVPPSSPGGDMAAGSPEEEGGQRFDCPDASSVLW